jgi:hypothetical protein
MGGHPFAAGPWIQVAERMPEPRILVLVVDHYGLVQLAARGRDGDHWTTRDGSVPPTHWAELFPPKAE